MACTTAGATQSSMGRLMTNVEEAFAVANDVGSKADTAVALARKVVHCLQGFQEQIPCRANGLISPLNNAGIALFDFHCHCHFYNTAAGLEQMWSRLKDL